MKRLFTSLVLIALTISFFAQLPQKTSYQAVIRNSSGQLVSNHAVGMRISILQGSATGTPVYVETQTPTTNANGLATIEIGGGSVVSGTFAGINWASGPYYLKTETDPAGGSSYTITGTSQLLSVPYALYSKTSESVADNSITSAKISDGAISAADMGVNAVITEKISAGAVTGAKIAQAGATSGQALKWNGTTWAPAADNNGGLTLPYSGTATSNSPLFNITNLGTSGAISTFSSGNYGIWGESGSSSGMGVYGVNKTSTGTTYGVFGDVYSAGGFSGFFQGGKFYIQGNTGIGTQNPSAKLEVSGQVKITGGSPGAGKVLTSDASGLASWQTPNISPWQKNGSDIYYNNGYVAVGMTFPRYRLTIYDDNDSWIGFYNSASGTTGSDGFTIGSSAAGSAVWIWNCENSNMHFGTNNDNRMIINADGRISMMKSLDLNTESTFGALYVKGKQALWWDGNYFSWGYDGTYNYFADRVTIGNPADPGTGYMLYVQGTAFATGAWNSSDAGFKKNISTLENSLDKVMKIRGTRFEFRTDEFNDYHFAEGPQYGFIAQELENIFPEVVKTESNGYKSVNYNGMIPVLLESIKEQQLQIESLQKQIDELNQLVKTFIPK